MSGSPSRQGAKLAIAALFVAIAFAAVLFVRGWSSDGTIKLSGSVMGTFWHVRAIAASSDAGRLRDVVQGALDDVDLRFSTYKADSELSRFNAHRSTEPFPVDADFADIVGEAQRIAVASGGAYDPTIFPVVRLWGWAGGPQREPTAEELTTALAHVGHARLAVLPGHRLQKSDPELQIDLSSIAKGYGVDRASRALAAAGFAAHMVEVGGEVVCRGSRPDGAAWHIAIRRPNPDEAEDGDPVQEVIDLRDRAVATSGSYENWFESGGKRRHHILDARTGRNADSRVVSVSVIAADCTLADGLATALMIVGPQSARDVIAACTPSPVGVLFLLEDPAGQGPNAVREVPIDWPGTSR